MNGRVQMKRHVTIKTTCPADRGSDFPFDYHQCSFKLGVRDLKDHELKLSMDKMNYYSVRKNVPTVPLVNIQRHLGPI